MSNIFSGVEGGESRLQTVIIVKIIEASNYGTSDKGPNILGILAFTFTLVSLARAWKIMLRRFK